MRAAVTGTLDGVPPRFVAIDATVSADCDDPKLLDKLVTIAERACIVANTLRDALKLRVRVEREELRQTSTRRPDSP